MVIGVLYVGMHTIYGIQIQHTISILVIYILDCTPRKILQNIVTTESIGQNQRILGNMSVIDA